MGCCFKSGFYIMAPEIVYKMEESGLVNYS